MAYVDRTVEFTVGRLGIVDADPSLLKQALVNLIGPRHVHQRKRVRHRLHAAHVHGPQLLDITEDAAQLRSQALLLLRCQGDARQVGHVVNIESLRNHARDAT